MGEEGGARGERELCDASTPWPTQSSLPLSLPRVIGRPLYHVTLQHYSERVTSNIPWLARFSFAFLG